jgi:hypothetical protein
MRLSGKLASAADRPDNGYSRSHRRAGVRRLEGIEHKPYAQQEMKLLLIVPRGVPNAGD